MSKTELYPLHLNVGLVTIKTIPVFPGRAYPGDTVWTRLYTSLYKYQPEDRKACLTTPWELIGAVGNTLWRLRHVSLSDESIWAKKGGIIALGAFSSLTGVELGTCIIVEGELCGLVMDPTWRDQGIGAELLVAAELCGAERLSCFEGLRGYYESKGWKVSSTEPNWDPDGPQVCHMRAPGHDA
ncbi:hypothetical protein [Pseudomonas phage PJNP013]|uniref:N-acetyltransferase domain-containing protein n=1 Tax=Pseudomonas phage PJNP013 TaxID=3108093 RepID=A0ABZ2CQP5_9CAUD